MALLPAVAQLNKLVMYFRSPSGKGWSEGHYLPAGTPTSVDAAAQQLGDYRLALLPPDCSMVYAKTSQLGPPQDSSPLNYSYPTPGTWPGDPFTTPATAPPAGSLVIEIADIAVALRVLGPDGRAASRWVHGVPDNRVTGETLTDAITIATVAPPAIGAGGFSTDWATRFGYYMYWIKLNTVYGQKQRGPGGIPQWGTEPISRIMVRGVVKKNVGRPFGVPRGRASVGR